MKVFAGFILAIVVIIAGIAGFVFSGIYCYYYWLPWSDPKTIKPATGASWKKPCNKFCPTISAIRHFEKINKRLSIRCWPAKML